MSENETNDVSNYVNQVKAQEQAEAQNAEQDSQQKAIDDLAKGFDSSMNTVVLKEQFEKSINDIKIMHEARISQLKSEYDKKFSDLIEILKRAKAQGKALIPAQPDVNKPLDPKSDIRKNYGEWII
jgi:hypothetical protein